MALVVLLRGANLGNRRFSPKAVEAALADLGTVSVGAAGSFVVRRPPARAALLRRLEDALPFEPRSIVVSQAQVRAALDAGARLKDPAGSKRFATAVDRPPKSPKLPLAEPSGKWGVRVVAFEGPFALGFRRPLAVAGVYPNAVVEKAWGVAATTRDWATLEKVGALLGVERPAPPVAKRGNARGGAV